MSVVTRDAVYSIKKAIKEKKATFRCYAAALEPTSLLKNCNSDALVAPRHYFLCFCFFFSFLHLRTPFSKLLSIVKDKNGSIDLPVIVFPNTRAGDRLYGDKLVA